MMSTLIVKEELLMVGVMELVETLIHTQRLMSNIHFYDLQSRKCYFLDRCDKVSTDKQKMDIIFILKYKYDPFDYYDPQMHS